MITIKTKASKRKKPDGTGWKCEASITYEQFTAREMESLTPTERKYITTAAEAYSVLEANEVYIKYQQKKLPALERERIKTLQAYSRYLQKENSPVSGLITVMMRVILYRDYMRKDGTDESPDEIPF